MERVLDKAHTIDEVLSTCISDKLTFAAYRAPGNPAVSIVIQKDHLLKQLNDLSKLTKERGFLIAPFTAHNGDRTYLISPDIIINDMASAEQYNVLRALSSRSLNGSSQVFPKETPKEEYIEQISKTISEIKEGNYEKVVISRVKIVDGRFSSRLVSIFKILCESYRNAFVYMFRIKGHLWIGATPEPLICSNGNELTTVSLAGTRTFSDANLDIRIWNHKERDEQEYVTKYIENVLKEYFVNDYMKVGPYTKKAGRLLHLRTDFSFSFDSVRKNISALVGALHPTSAVCGIPMEPARNFIREIENHNREYYSGYLGPIGLGEKVQLYVNLRCMKVFDNKLALFVGSGITAESVPEEEWDETEIKADTLLSVVQQLD